jgi:hypothetical protein
MTDVSEARTVSIIREMMVLMMEAVCTCETSVNIYLIARQYIPEDSKLHYVHSYENVEASVQNKTG